MYRKPLLLPLPPTALAIHTLNPPLQITKITDVQGLQQLDEFFAKLAEKKDFTVGWDIETTPLKDFFFRRCRTIQFGNTHEQYVIDLLPFASNDPGELFDTQGWYGSKLSSGLQTLANRLKPITCGREWKKVGVNLGFEYQSFYWLFGQRSFNFYDCMMAEKCIWAGAHSMKDYGYFSMGSMMERYFKLIIDKQFQESFTLDAVLSDGQIEYAALDTRFPMAIMQVQKLIAKGVTLAHLKKTKSTAVKFFDHLEPKVPGSIEPIIMGDDLTEITQIENDAIGSFEDMHIHGEKMDRPRWKTRVIKRKEALFKLYKDELDPYFIHLVGSKHDIKSDEEINAAELKWKAYNTVSLEETKLKAQIRTAQKTGQPGLAMELQFKQNKLAEARIKDKDFWKQIHSDMKKKRTKVKNLAAKCEGDALINYSSDAQLLAVLNTVKGLKSVKSLDDENLEKYELQGFAIMGSLRKLHSLTKEIGTYGDQWAQEWATKPCKEEGWLNPGDGRLHCVYNQYDAETGRSSSEKPNGQNLPQDEDIRSSFIADDNDENIRVSNCCEADCQYTPGVNTDDDEGKPIYRCLTCSNYCGTHAEEYVIITADMSGAELRIIAELADDPVWIGAFNRGEDVHSVGTELLRGEAWNAGTEPGCKYYALNVKGEPARQKCKCVVHAEQRNDNKSTNFLLAYGGGPHTLAKAIKKALEKAQELMALHASKFPKIWAYLDKSGKNARMYRRAFDMFGRRRLFVEPTWDRAKQKVKDDREEKLLIDEDEALQKIELFKNHHKRPPSSDELWDLTHRQPTSKEIGSMLAALNGSIERQGKNHAIQGTNATIIKRAFGAGFDKDDKPYLWHVLPKYKAKLLKMVHDELVVQCPKRYAKEVAALIGDAFKRAAAEKMSKVVMEFDFNIAKHWKK